MPRAESPVSRVAHPVARVLVGLVLTPHLAGRTRADLSLPRASRTPSRLGQSALFVYGDGASADERTRGIVSLGTLCHLLTTHPLKTRTPLVVAARDR